MSNTFKLRNGRLLISTEAPGGIYNASQLKKIASLCDGDSVMVKATEDQRLALIVDPDKASAVASELQSMGLGIRHYQDGLHQPVSCIGEMCEFHDQDALGSALDISSAVEGIKLDNPLKIGINGCARCCVPCHTLDISVVGDSHGYRISLGGKNSQLPEIAGFLAEGVPPSEIPRLMTSIIEIYKANAHEGETLQELIDRQGPSAFIKALAPWSQDAAEIGDPFAPGTETNEVSDSPQHSEEITAEEILEDDMSNSHETVLSSENQDIPPSDDVDQNELSEADKWETCDILGTQKDDSLVQERTIEDQVSEDEIVPESELNEDHKAVSLNNETEQPAFESNSEPAFDEDVVEAKISADLDTRPDTHESDNLELERDHTTDLLDDAKITLSVETLSEKIQSSSNESSEDHEAVSLDGEISSGSQRIQAIRALPQKKGRTVSGFDLDDEGNPVISWSDGTVLTLAQEAITVGTLKFFGHTVTVTKQAEGLNVEVDGIRMFLPFAA